ncbi:MAG: hypothetical protein WC373_17130, partial [Smithella sp.]
MNGINPKINKLFYDLTGLPARTQKEADASLRSLNPEKWDKWQADKKTSSETSRVQREAKRKQDALDNILNKEVKFEGKVVKTGDLYKRLVAEGYTEIRKSKSGIADMYRLVNNSIGKTVRLEKKIVVDHVQALIDAKKSEPGKGSKVHEGEGNNTIELAQKKLDDASQDAITAREKYDNFNKFSKNPETQLKYMEEKRQLEETVKLAEKNQEEARGELYQTKIKERDKNLPESKLPTDPEAKVVAPTKTEEKNITTPKEQKKYLLGKIDEALKDAPDVELDMARHNFKYASEKDRERWFNEDKKVYEANKKKYGTVIIEVPNDGTFNILNVKSSLEQFKKQTVNFPASVIKGSAELKTPLASKRVTGMRMELEDVSYYNEFKPREQGLVEGKRFPAVDKVPEVNQNFYVDGYFTNGQYLVKTEKPKFKLSNNKPDVKRVIPKDAGSPTKIVAEFYRGGGKDRESATVHAIAEDGTENAFNAHYVDSILTLYPDAKVFMTSGMKPMVFKEGKEVVGLVMPLRDAVPSREFINEFKVEQTTPKSADMLESAKPAKVETKAEPKNFKEFVIAQGYEYPDSISKAQKPMEEFARVNKAKLKEENKTVADLTREFRGEEKPKEAEQTGDVEGFVADLNPMQKGRAISTLNVKTRYDGVVKTLKEHVENLIAAGRKTTTKESIDENARSEAQQERSRILKDGNQNIKAVRLKELDDIISNPPKKTSYRLTAEDGSFYELNKTGYNYAKYLEGESPKVETKTAVNETPIEEGIKEWQDIPELDAQIRTIEEPTKDFNKWTIEIGAQESLGEKGGDILTRFYKEKPTLQDIKDDIIEHYRSEKIKINEEVAVGIIAKTGREEMVEGAIDKVLTANTDDSGAELTYNKRNRIKTGIKWEDISGKNTALKVKETTKQNVYPKPDYQQMIDDGGEPLIIHILKQTYDAISIKPTTRNT